MPVLSFLTGSNFVMGPVLAGAVIVFCVFWFYQFVQLMLLSEADFPGKHDKPLWVAVFVLAFVFAPFAFFGWKYAYQAMLADQSRRAAPKA